MNTWIRRLLGRSPDKKTEREICLWMDTGLVHGDYDAYWVSRSTDTRSYTISIVEDRPATITHLFRSLDQNTWHAAMQQHLAQHGAGVIRSCYRAKCICHHTVPGDHHQHILVPPNLPIDTIGIIHRKRNHDYIQAICARKAIVPGREYIIDYRVLQGIHARHNDILRLARANNLNPNEMFVATNTSGHLIKTIVDTFHLRICEDTSAHRPH